jgi:PAS domain S-box-containing protein
VAREGQLPEANKLLAAIVESCEDAIISKDLNSIVTSWNRSAERMFEYRADEMIGQSIIRIIPPELRDDERVILGKILNGQRVEHFETVRLTRSGKRIDVSLTVSPVKDSTGRVIGAAKIVRDITERKQIERAFRASMEKTLQDTLTQLKILRGLLPICAGCKSIRNREGSWERLEKYISEHSQAEFTHGLCPKCAKRYGWPPQNQIAG